MAKRTEQYSNNALFAEDAKGVLALVPEAVKRLESQEQRGYNAGVDVAALRSKQRWSVLNNCHAPLIAARVSQVQKQDRIRDRILKHVTTVFNPAADVESVGCQVYKHGVRREIVGDEQGTEDLIALFRSSRLNVQLQDLNRAADFCGPIPVVALPREDGVTAAAFLRHNYVPILDEGDPLGELMGFVACFASGYVVVTRESIHRFQKDDRDQLYEDTSARLEGLQNRPFATMRYSTPLSVDDWENVGRAQRLFDAAIDVGVIAATMNYVRKAQNKYLLKAVGDIDSLPQGQSVADPEGALLAEATAQDRMDIEAMEFDTDPANFIKHIDCIYDVSTESYLGITVGLSGEREPTAIFDAVTELRQSQLQYAIPFDRDIAVALCEVGKRVPGVDCPDPEKVKEKYMAEFGPMSRRFADPAQEAAWWEHCLKYGRFSVLDILRKDHRDVSDKALRERQRRNLDENTKYLEELATRNQPADPAADVSGDPKDPKMESVPQKQGRKGGNISADRGNAGKPGRYPKRRG